MGREAVLDRNATRWTVVVFLVCFIGACSKTVIGPNINHGTFEPYFQRFVADAAKYGRNISDDEAVLVVFGTIDGASGDVAGQCQTNPLTGNKIVIKEDTWNGLDDGSKESLIFHEFGHCILNRGHIATSDMVSPPFADPSGSYTTIPASIMYPSFPSGPMYLLYQDYYLNELFSNAQN